MTNVRIEVKEIVHYKESNPPIAFRAEIDIAGLNFDESTRHVLRPVGKSGGNFGLFPLRTTAMNISPTGNFMLSLIDSNTKNRYYLTFLSRGGHLTLCASNPLVTSPTGEQIRFDRWFPQNILPDGKYPDNQLVPLPVSTKEMYAEMIRLYKKGVKLIEKEGLVHHLSVKDVAKFKEDIKKEEGLYADYFEVAKSELKLPATSGRGGFDFKAIKLEGTLSSLVTRINGPEYKATFVMHGKRHLPGKIPFERFKRDPIANLTGNFKVYMVDPVAHLTDCLHDVIALFHGATYTMGWAFRAGGTVPSGGFTCTDTLKRTGDDISFTFGLATKTTYPETYTMSLLTYAKAFVHAAESLEALMKRKGHLETYKKVDPYVYKQFKKNLADVKELIAKSMEK